MKMINKRDWQRVNAERKDLEDSQSMTTNNRQMVGVRGVGGYRVTKQIFSQCHIVNLL